MVSIIVGVIVLFVVAIIHYSVMVQPSRHFVDLFGRNAQFLARCRSVLVHPHEATTIHVHCTVIATRSIRQCRQQSALSLLFVARFCICCCLTVAVAFMLIFIRVHTVTRRRRITGGLGFVCGSVHRQQVARPRESWWRR